MQFVVSPELCPTSACLLVGKVSPEEECVPASPKRVPLAAGGNCVIVPADPQGSFASSRLPQIRSYAGSTDPSKALCNETIAQSAEERSSPSPTLTSTSTRNSCSGLPVWYVVTSQMKSQVRYSVASI